KVSLIEPPVPRVSSESNLQLLRTEEQARLIPAGLGQKFTAKNRSTTSIDSEPANISAADVDHKHIPTPIVINVSNTSPSNSIAATVTPLRERHLSLVGKSIESPKAAAATSTNTTTAIATLEMPLAYTASRQGGAILNLGLPTTD